jgi:hypothetical protein
VTGATVEILRGTTGYMKASKQFQVPPSILQLKKKKQMAVHQKQCVRKVMFLTFQSLT